MAVLAACGNSEPLNRSGDPGAPPSGADVNADFHTLATPPLAAGQIELLTLSTLPDTVSGGDVLVAVRGLAGDDRYTVTRNGEDVSSAFSRDAAGEAHGLVTGLHAGINALTATVEGRAGKRVATLTVKNHPITGPVISGPHQTPFYCRTEDAGLGAPLDEHCSIETKYQWFYRGLDQSYTELTDPYAPYPSDVIMTETSDGRAVPFVVRVETATINRGIVRIAVLDDPAARGPDAPFDARNWNHQVFYAFGESCGVGYHQGVNTVEFVLGGLPELTEISADRLFINLAGVGDRLTKGDITVHSTLSAFGTYCNPLVSIESAMMVKEHIAEQYGLVKRVVGTNGSGAALQQYNAANNAPGLLSAALPTASFADVLSTAMTVTDCGLLLHYYETSGLDWSDAKRAAVNGHDSRLGTILPGQLGICQSWNDTFLSILDPHGGCSGAVPEEVRYHPETNPGGVRCTLQDATVNFWGRDPQTGFARRPLDNAGVQYGLDALNRGVISFDEFLDLNRNIGGFDIDGQFAPERMRMDSEVAVIAYRLGGVIGRGALAETPVMDLGPYLDLIPVANIHEAVRPFIIRARLREHTGQDVTQSIWRGVLTQPDAYPVMDEWLAALRRPAPGGDHVQAVMAAKPEAAGDRCTIGTVGGRLELPDALLLPLGVQAPLLPQIAPLYELVPDFDLDVPVRIDVPEDFDSGLGACSLLLEVTRTPRLAAGMPMTDDVIRCQLKPVDPADYDPPLNEEQLAQLREVFAEGVCDYDKPAAEDVAKSMIWASLGGETLEAPHELKWRVARSGAP